LSIEELFVRPLHMTIELGLFLIFFVAGITAGGIAHSTVKCGAR